jgi:hypothetical protein
VRFPNTYYIDFTATLSITRAKYTSIWGIQVKNLLLENSIFYQRFNEERQEIEIDGSGFIFPNISYKIVF